MSSEDEISNYFINKYPDDFCFGGKVLPIFSLAFNEFNELSKGEWSLENYRISVSVSDDESYMLIAFAPNPAYMIDGVPFEVPDRGMYKNGMGVNYVYRLKDLALVKTIYMR